MEVDMESISCWVCKRENFIIMYRIITEETMAGDKAVTSHYLKIIYEAIIKAGKECAGWTDGVRKRTL